MAIETDFFEVDHLEEIRFQGRSLRIYTPKGAIKGTCILFIHGGAFIAGSLDTHDNLCRCLCQKVACKVVSIDYPLAPENKFPKGLEYCYKVALWLASQGDRIAIVGDSAGANLATALCLLARDRKRPEIACQVLINPVCSLDQLEENSFLQWQADMYLNTPEDALKSYVSPALANDLERLPPALVIVAELDDLKNDGENYHKRLHAAGNATELFCQKGVHHLAGHAARAAPLAYPAINVAVNKLKNYLIDPK